MFWEKSPDMYAIKISLRMNAYFHLRKLVKFWGVSTVTLSSLFCAVHLSFSLPPSFNHLMSPSLTISFSLSLLLSLIYPVPLTPSLPPVVFKLPLPARMTLSLIQYRDRRCYVTVAIFTFLLYLVWKDMNHRTTQTVNKDNLKWLEVTEVSYNNAWMRSRPVRTGAIHTHKHYSYGLCKKKADDLFYNNMSCL